MSPAKRDVNIYIEDILEAITKILKIKQDLG